MTDDARITLDPAARRFELAEGGQVAYLEFEPLPGAIALVHTVVPPALGGRGLGGALVRHALDHAARQGLKVRPDCTFAKAWIERHPEYRDLSLAPGAAP